MTDGQTVGAEAALLSREEYLGLVDVAGLEAAFAARGFTGVRKKLLAKARKEWFGHAVAAAKEASVAPECLEPLSRERGGVRYDVYGVFHGIMGGNDRDYKAFVNKAVGELDFVVFENGLNHFYPHRAGAVIPDFMVLGVIGSLAIGLKVGVYFPMLLLEAFGELFKTRLTSAEDPLLSYDLRYHGLDPELRRGLDEDPSFPSLLQIDLELSAWKRSRVKALIADNVAIVPRSMFMAGFAVGLAEARGDRRVSLVVGDLHTMEILRFLEDTELDHPVFIEGMQVGRRRGVFASLLFYWAKVIHLGCAGLAGSLVLSVVLVPLIWWLLG
jgi:hypothetical protein